MNTKMKTVKQFISLKGLAVFASALAMVSCDDDDNNTIAAPEPEQDVEVITDVTLIFTNAADATDVVTATATDGDGDGIDEELEVREAITLSANTTYNLTFEILNASDSTKAPDDIAEEILEEADEHQLFYGFTEGAFSNPMGNGNIDNSQDAVNYTDLDDNNLPVGLTTTWTTAGAATGSSFRVVLQHQPAENGVAVKTATSGATNGDTDFDLNFVLNIEE